MVDLEPVKGVLFRYIGYPTYYAIGAFDKDAYKKLAKSFETGDDTDKENKFYWCISWNYKKVLILWTSHKSGINGTFLQVPDGITFFVILNRPS